MPHYFRICNRSLRDTFRHTLPIPIHRFQFLAMHRPSTGKKQAVVQLTASFFKKNVQSIFTRILRRLSCVVNFESCKSYFKHKLFSLLGREARTKLRTYMYIHEDSNSVYNARVRYTFFIYLSIVIGNNYSACCCILLYTTWFDGLRIFMQAAKIA